MKLVFNHAFLEIIRKSISFLGTRETHEELSWTSTKESLAKTVNGLKFWKIKSNSFLLFCFLNLKKSSFEAREILSPTLFHSEFFKNKKGPGTSFQATFFVWFSDIFWFLVLHKLSKSHYQSVLVLSYSVKHISCFILRHLMTSFKI